MIIFPALVLLSMPTHKYTMAQSIKGEFTEPNTNSQAVEKIKEKKKMRKYLEKAEIIKA